MKTRPPSVAPTRPDFDSKFRADPDPWQFEHSPYEVRKRARILAALPKPRYQRAFEPGCANGVFTAVLAQRAERLIAWDVAPSAIELARRRLVGTLHVRTAVGRVPQQWPDGWFDLIVIGELGYYLDVDELETLARRLATSLKPGGDLLACHWRAPIADALATGDEVHARLVNALRWPRASHVEREFRIDVWSRPISDVSDHGVAEGSPGQAPAKAVTGSTPLIPSGVTAASGSSMEITSIRPISAWHGM